MELNHSPARIVTALLIDLGIGTDPADEDAWPIYYGKEPDLPDNCITVRNTAGVVQGYRNPTGDAAEQYGIQIRVRGTTEEVGYAKVNALAVSLDRQTSRVSVTIGASDYCVDRVTRASPVLSLGNELSSKRYLFTVNALASLIMST